MADNVRYILDKLAALFRLLEDTELFTQVGFLRLYLLQKSWKLNLPVALTVNRMK